MKLYTSGPSPFVRKVLVVAHELGLWDRIEQVQVAISPVSPSSELAQANPLGKIPAFCLPDGSALYDSRVIVEYLDALSDRHVIPPAGPERWAALRTAALADGIVDAGILVRYETFLRPEALRWSDWVLGQCTKFTQGLEVLEATCDTFGDRFDVGQIAVACALGWLEFRKPLELDPRGPSDARARAPKLFAWFDRVATRPSLLATSPKA